MCHLHYFSLHRSTVTSPHDAVYVSRDEKERNIFKYPLVCASEMYDLNIFTGSEEKNRQKLKQSFQHRISQKLYINLKDKNIML